MEEKSEEKRSEDATLVALKLEEEATSHGLQMASRSWKKARKQILPLKPPKKCSPADPFWISDSRTAREGTWGNLLQQQPRTNPGKEM